MSPENANEYERLMKNRPHVVILGAGATMAAIPGGDKNGKKIWVRLKKIWVRLELSTIYLA